MSRHIGLPRILLFLLAWVLGTQTSADARTFAYLFFGANGQVLTLDTETDTIVAQRPLSLPPKRLGDEVEFFVALTDNLLLVGHGSNDEGRFGLAVYDMKTLTFQQDLGLLSKEPPEVFLPPNTPHFFVLWWDPKAASAETSPVVTRFAKGSFARLADLKQVPLMANRASFAPDGSRLYSFTPRSDDPVQVVDPQDFRLLQTIEVPPLLAPARYGGDLADVRGGRLLLVENLKSGAASPSRYTLFTVRLSDGSTSPQIATEMQGEAWLTPAGDKILFSETVPVIGSGGIYEGAKHLGRLHVYDVATGAELGQATFPVHSQTIFPFIRPQGDKVYLFSGGGRYPSKGLAVVSLVTFTLLKELNTPPAEMFFFDEP